MFNIGISRDSHLLLVCTGKPVYDDFLAMIDLAGAAVDREGWARVLVDCTSVPPTFTPDELARLGAYAGRALARAHVALVVSDEGRFDTTRSAANSAGGNLRQFSKLAEASAWLASVRKA